MKLLALDFDGVLHRGSDSVLIDFNRPMPAWQLEITLKTQGRFVWAPLLSNALEDSDVSIVIHSTWRKQFSDATLKQFLPPDVAARVISLDGQIEGRGEIHADDYLMQALTLIAPTSLCVLDDRPEFFYGGKVKNWIEHNDGKFLWCHQDVGLKDPNITRELACWSRSEPKLAHHSAPVNS